MELLSAQGAAMAGPGSPPPAGRQLARADLGTLTASDIKAVKDAPAEAVIMSWKDSVCKLSTSLVQLDRNPDHGAHPYQEAMDALCCAVDQAMQLVWRTAVLQPNTMQELRAATLDHGHLGVSADDRANWACVAASLELSEEQKTQVLSLHRMSLRRMLRVMDSRRQVLAKLKGVCVAETVQVNECIAKLTATVGQEQVVCLDFNATMFKLILSPIQKARAIVESYPLYPDFWQIATVLAAERKGPSALGPDRSTTTIRASAAGAATFAALSAAAHTAMALG